MWAVTEDDLNLLLLSPAHHGRPLRCQHEGSGGDEHDQHHASSGGVPLSPTQQRHPYPRRSRPDGLREALQVSVSV